MKKITILNPINGNGQSWVQTPGNANPFGANIIANQAITNATSIPSPYARMHLFEIAFQKLADGANNHPDELRRCVSNCLDVFELLFRCRKEQELRNLGVTVMMHRYKDVTEVQGNTPRANNERKYLDSLCVFRNAYRMNFADQSLFKVFFTIRKDNQIIAATSPFTGFYLKEDNIQTVVYNGKTYFSPDEFDQVTRNRLWVPLNQRGQDFQQFMYKLVDYLINNVGGSFGRRYKALQDYINNQLPAAAGHWNNPDFAAQYPEFDFAGITNCSWGFPIYTQNPLWNGHNVHVIPNSFDCSFLRYMLVPQEKATFELNKDDYNPNINQRRNPINGTLMEWVSVDDFLADRVIVIQGEINNEKYFAIEDQNHCCKVIPPLTDRFFEFFKVEDLKGNGMGRVKMSLHSEFDTNCPKCIVTLDIPYRNAGGAISYLTLSKTYSGFDQCVMNVNIELGIFPFIKTPNNVDDFYRIALYANKDLKLSDLDIIQFNSDGYNNGSTILADDSRYIRRRFTNGNVALSTALQTDLLYYSLESTFNAATGLMSHRDVSFDLLKIKYCIDRPIGREDCEVIIVPFMEEVPQGNANVRIAIDFGTSNTFVAYNTSGNAQNTKDFETTQSPHCGETLFVKFAKLVDNPNLKEKFDFANNRLTQRCEFMPAYFNTGNGFKFPVASILNVKNTPDNILRNYAQGDAVSILDADIPFAYFDDGIRELPGNTIDNIREGFKWINPTDTRSKGLIYLYIEELLLLLRSRVLSEGTDITNAQLYFTYPLAFSDSLAIEYHAIAKLLYAKYFNLSNNPQNCNTLNVYNGITNVIFDNESKTPIFSDPAIMGGDGNVGTVMSADIGGGSCDIMIYNRAVQRVEKCFSFEFAGNNLFGCGKVQNRDNVWFKDVAKELLPSVNDNNSINSITQKKIEADENSYNIITLMNSLFANNPDGVDMHVANSVGCSFITLLFSSAIYYQMATICRASGIIPESVFLSGSGSKLLNMQQNRTPAFDRNQCNETIGKVIFAAVISEQAGIINGRAFNIVSSKNPKAATAYGILSAACAGIAGGGVNEHWIDYGESEGRIYRQLDPGQLQNPNNEPTPHDISEFQNDLNSNKQIIFLSVMDNVNRFFSIFFSDVLPRFAQLDAKFTYDVKDSESIQGKTNIHYIINNQFDSINKGYRDTINGAQPGKYLDSLFLKIISRIISDLCKTI